MNTKSYCKILSFLSLTAVLGTCMALGEVREEFHQTYPLTKSGRLQLENVNGSVRITTWDKEEVKVDAIKKAKQQEHLEEVKIDITSSADSLKIRTKYPDRKSSNNSTTVEYTLTVPKQSHLGKISNVNGSVEIENAGGDVAVSSVNGAVLATGLSGEAQLSTVNGSVRASFAGLKSPVSIKSVNGSVTLVLPANANADVAAETVNGEIHSDFSVQPKKGFSTGSKLQGKLGEGGPAVKLATVNGGIRLERSKVVEAESR